MPILIALLGMVLAAGYWAWRIKIAKEALSDVAGIAGDVMSAARRLGFRRKANVHPVESVDEPALAIAGLGIAYLDLAALPTAEDLERLKSALQTELHVSEVKADELLIVARWLVNECKGADAALTRLSRRLLKLDPAGFQQLLPVLNTMSNGAPPSPRQRDGLDEIARIFRLN